jgi:hypothetical protein
LMLNYRVCWEVSIPDLQMFEQINFWPKIKKGPGNTRALNF